MAEQDHDQSRTYQAFRSPSRVTGLRAMQLCIRHLTAFESISKEFSDGEKSEIEKEGAETKAVLRHIRSARNNFSLAAGFMTNPDFASTLAICQSKLFMYEQVIDRWEKPADSL